MNNGFQKLILKSVITLVVCSTGLLACSEDDNNKDTNTNYVDDYVLTTKVPGADMTTFAQYAQTFDLHSTESTISNSNATEIEAQYSTVVFPFNGSLYFSKYTVSKVEKWNINESGELSQSGEIDFSELGYQSNLCFWNKEVAFTGGPGLFKIAIFNPSTMTHTGLIDLTDFSRINSVTNFPETGSAIGMQSPSEMIIRDNYMYIAIYYCLSGPGGDTAWQPAIKSCEIIVVDLNKVDPASTDNSEAVVKKISDPRGSFTGAWASGGGSSFMILDENNDIYVLCHNMWANYRSLTGLPTCVLRIKDGDTDFDPDYYFDLEAASTGEARPAMGLEYAGNGKFFGAVQDPAAIDPDNAYSYYLDPIYQWYQFDLYNKSAQQVSATYTKGAEAGKCYFEDNFAYLPMVTADENYVQKVNIESLETEKLFSTIGDPLILKMK